jgi:hypothetical protein
MRARSDITVAVYGQSYRPHFVCGHVATSQWLCTVSPTNRTLYAGTQRDHSSCVQSVLQTPLCMRARSEITVAVYSQSYRPRFVCGHAARSQWLCTVSPTDPTLYAGTQRDHSGSVQSVLQTPLCMRSRSEITVAVYGQSYRPHFVCGHAARSQWLCTVSPTDPTLYAGTQRDHSGCVRSVLQTPLCMRARSEITVTVYGQSYRPHFVCEHAARSQ